MPPTEPHRAPSSPTIASISSDRIRRAPATGAPADVPVPAPVRLRRASPLTQPAEPPGAARVLRRAAINVQGARAGDPTIIRRVLVNNGDDRRPLTPADVAKLIAANPAFRRDIDVAHQAPQQFVAVATTRSGFRLEPVPDRPERGGGDNDWMFGRASTPADPDEALQQLCFAGETEDWIEMIADDLGTTMIGDYPMPVLKQVPKRKPRHRAKFAAESGYDRAADAAMDVEDEFATFTWEIGHLKGHGQVGADADVEDDNLAAITDHANTEMMFFDDEVSGNPDVLIETVASVYVGTRVAKEIEMRFTHVDDPDDPFFTRTIPAIRPRVTREEAQALRARARLQVRDGLARAAAKLSARRPDRMDVDPTTAQLAGTGPMAGIAPGQVGSAAPAAAGGPVQDEGAGRGMKRPRDNGDERVAAEGLQELGDERPRKRARVNSTTADGHHH